MESALQLKKKELRASISRNEIKEKEQHSEEISRRVMALPQWSSSRIMSYISFENEVDTGKINESRDKIFVPCISPDKDMVALPMGKACERGAYNVLQPPFNANEAKNSNAFDIILVPGIAFDKRGARLGRGKGYYDKFLSNTSALKVGLAFESQLVDNVPTESHDILMNYIITERRDIQC